MGVLGSYCASVVQVAKGDIVEKMKAVLVHTEKIVDVLGLPKARVPVVKFNVVLSDEVFIKVSNWDLWLDTPLLVTVQFHCHCRTDPGF
jgi:hypothetical protein